MTDVTVTGESCSIRACVRSSLRMRPSRLYNCAPRMSLVPGAKLGPYEILSAIGAGGMGEVYRARDTRLNRIVAIKVLSKKVTAQPELRERFEREARTISSLQHPNI